MAWSKFEKYLQGFRGKSKGKRRRCRCEYNIKTDQKYIGQNGVEQNLFWLRIGRSGRYRWPRLQRHRSAAAHLQGLRVRIPPGKWMFVVCCQVEVSATSCSTVQISPTDCGVSSCVI
jgi:hypothetical protein